MLEATGGGGGGGDGPAGRADRAFSRSRRSWPLFRDPNEWINVEAAGDVAVVVVVASESSFSPSPTPLSPSLTDNKLSIPSFAVVVVDVVVSVAPSSCAATGTSPPIVSFTSVSATVGRSFVVVGDDGDGMFSSGIES